MSNQITDNREQITDSKELTDTEIREILSKHTQNEIFALLPYHTRYKALENSHRRWLEGGRRLTEELRLQGLRIAELMAAKDTSTTLSDREDGSDGNSI